MNSNKGTGTDLDAKDGGNVGKKARQVSRAAAAQRRQSSQRHRRPLWISASLLVAVALLALVIVTVMGSGSGSLPAGTKTFAEKNHRHVVGVVQYGHTPPAGGAHSAAWLNCGVYAQPVPNDNAVHSLEHGAVWITYRPSLSSTEIASLQLFVASHYDGAQRYLLLSPYPNLPAPVVASAWGAQIRLTGASDPRLAKFVSHFIGGAQGGELGAACSGGVGTPSG